MPHIDQQLLDRLAQLTLEAKSRGWTDAATWIQRQLTNEIVTKRPRRQRGVKVMLGRINRAAVLDADVVKELMEKGKPR